MNAVVVVCCNYCTRCAELSLVAIVNKLPESWICFRPVLPLMYASQYLPGISKFVLLIIWKTKKISIRHPSLYVYVVRIMILNQGGDVRPGTCFSSQSKGQQKCHGVRKTEIKACLFDENVLFSHTFFVKPAPQALVVSG